MNTTIDDNMMKIDVDAIVRKRLKRYSRFIPRWLTRQLEKTICQDDLNHLLQHNAGTTGGKFCHGVLSDLDVKAEFHGEENIPADNRRLVFVSNHPLGGLDGMIYIDYLTRKFAPAKPRFIVNDLLMAVEPLHDVFLPVNKHGSQSKDRIKAIDEAFAGDDPIIVFPAGLVSRLTGFGKGIRDLQWHKMFVKKCIEHNRTVIPSFFCGKNSSFFYNFAHIRRYSGLKFNIEMIFLPREVIKSKGKLFSIYFGKPVATDKLKESDPDSIAEQIKDLVYTLRPAGNKC